MSDQQVRLADLTTFRLGGPARRFVDATAEAELVSAVRDADDAGEPLLVIGAGSNLLVDDDGFAGTVVRVATRGVTVQDDGCGGAWVEVAAGEPWDGVVARAVAEGWSGIEALSGIPGSTGATPMQNVGAYGQEVAQTIARVRAFDRSDGTTKTFAAADCGFGYRSSRFRHDQCFVVLSVTFQLPFGSQGTPVRHAELADVLGIAQGSRAPASDVRAAVLELRARKGMVLDEADHDTWSAGSFFLNPLLTREEAASLPPELQRYPQDDGRVKVSAAWLVEQAGFAKGFRHAGAAVSTKHSLALTNRGDATSADVLQLARQIRDGVRDRFGVGLEPEPRLVRCHL